MLTICNAILRWKHKQLGHAWRPALTSRGPCRTCICGAQNVLTEAEFYAQFGVMPYVGVIGR